VIIAPTRDRNFSLSPISHVPGVIIAPTRDRNVSNLWVEAGPVPSDHRPYEGSQRLIGPANVGGIKVIIAPTRDRNVWV